MAKKVVTELLLWVFILSLLLVFGSVMVVSPFYGDINLIDEGQFGVWVLHLMQGDYLYRDSYAAYGPLYIYPGYLLSILFGPSVFLIRITYFVLNVFLALLIVRAVMHFLAVKKILQVLVLFFLVFVPGIGMRQGSGLLAVLLVYLVFQSKRLWLAFVAGFVWGSASLISQEIGIFVSVIAAILLSINAVSVTDVVFFWKKAAFLLLGLLTVLALFYVWSSSQGWFDAYIVSMHDDLRTYSGISMPVGQAFPNIFLLTPQTFSLYDWVRFALSKELLLYWLFSANIIALLVVVFSFVRKKTTPQDGLFFLVVLYSFTLSTILIGRSGHFTFTLAPVLIILVYFSDRLLCILRKTRDKTERSLSLVLLIVLSLFYLRTLLIYRPHFPEVFPALHAVFSDKTTPPYVGNVRLSIEQESSIRQLQQYVWDNTDASERIFFFSNTPMHYFLVNRLPPTRFDIPEIINTKEKRMEVLNDLKDDQTRMIINDTKGWDVDGVSNQRRLPEIFTYIESKYEKRKIGSFVIYIRRE